MDLGGGGAQVQVGAFLDFYNYNLLQNYYIIIIIAVDLGGGGAQIQVRARVSGYRF